MRLLAGIAVGLLTAAVVTGAILVFRFVHGGADTLAAMAPNDTAVYVNFDLDPSAGQKLAVAGLLDRFPGLSGPSREATINHWVDTTLSGSGLNHDDIRPWLGSNVSVVVLDSAFSSTGSTSTASAPPPVAVLIATNDEGKAQAALEKYTTGPAGSRSTWSTATFDGVAVTSGTGGGGKLVFAVTDHTAVVGSTTAVVDDIIDTSQGKRANLTSVSAYTTVQSHLPSERLASVYVNLGLVVNRVGSAISASGTSHAELSLLRAYTGMGLALVATARGIALDGTEDFDASKLTSDMRTLLNISPHVNGAVAYVPRNAYGLFAFTGLQQTLRGMLDAFGSALSPNVDATLRRLGLTGSGGIMQHLRGDAGVEVDALPGQRTPAGGLVFSTDSNSAAQSFLDKLASSLCSSSSSCDASHLATQTYRGASISSVPISSSGTVVEPSWAVSSGWAIIGSSPAEVRAILDARATGASIGTAPSYTKVVTEVSGSNNAFFYMDVHAVAGAVRGALPQQDQAAYDTSVAPYLNPFRAVGMSEQNASDHITISVFALVQ